MARDRCRLRPEVMSWKLTAAVCAFPAGIFLGVWGTRIYDHWRRG